MLFRMFRFQGLNRLSVFRIVGDEVYSIKNEMTACVLLLYMNLGYLKRQYEEGIQ